MKNYLFILILFLGLSLTCVHFFPLISNDTTQEIYSDEEEEGEEGLPGEFFFNHRVHPDEKFSVNTYTKGLAIAKQKAAQKTGVGFDTDWELQGPGNIGARVNSIAVHPTDESIIYLGFSSGGIFKTTDGGGNWIPIFDDQSYLSIGDIAIDPINPDIIYAGTGDPNITGYPFIGNGIYKSLDGGNTWSHMGLADQRVISKISINPITPNIIYVASMGLPFERNDQRGVYKSVDGGQSWSQSLFVDNQTGAIDFVLNPINPQVMFAAGWERIRNNSESILYGEGAKIHRSVDGGDTWTILSNGLPTSKQGRIGLAMSGINPDVVFAFYVDTTQQIGGLYKTIDAGDSWSEIQTATLPTNLLGGMGWYFGRVHVNPTNDDNIYINGVNTSQTTDGGITWFNAVNFDVHVDHHDLVFANSGDLFIATDGGAYKQTVNTSTWIDIENIAATQFYRVGYNPHQPNTYYGGSQDNGTVRGSSNTMNSWSRISGGDGFQPVFHPTDPNVFYTESQNGAIRMTSDGGVLFNNATNGISNTDRRNWDMQYIMSKHNPNKLYTGTYRVYRSNNDGSPLWSTISDDLTDGIINSPSFHTISCLDESGIDSLFLLVGTTDGNVWKTENGGDDWVSINENLPDRYVSSVLTSPDDSNTIYVSFTGYKDNDFSPLLYRSTDRGNNWEDISGDLPPLSINDIFVMPDYNGQVLFVATDGGVYASKDAGQSWERLGGNMPFIIVFDIELNVANNELIAGTHARSIMTFPLDSIGVLAAPTFFGLTGIIATETGELIDSVLISYDDGNSTSSMTDADGGYLLNQLVVGADCSLRPSKEASYRTGVSTVDILLLQRHILGLQPFDSPYKTIAGDVNRNEELTGTDIVAIRKLLVMLVDTFPNNTAWRFVPNTHSFQSVFDPWTPTFDDAYDCGTINTSQVVDFTAIKVGDVSHSYTNLQSSQIRESDKILYLELEDQVLEANQNYSIAFKAKDFKDIAGFQFSLQFHPEKLDYLGFKKGKLSSLGEEHFGTSFAKAGILNLSWDYLKGLSVDDGDVLFYLEFQALQNGPLNEILSLDNNFLNKEAYNTDIDVLGLDLQFINQDSKPIERLSLTNYPNPFSAETAIEFSVENEEKVSFTIFDVKGQLIFKQEKVYAQGSQKIEINQSQLKGSGLYFYFLKTDNQIRSGKMILE